MPDPEDSGHLILTNGTVIDPAQGIHQKLDVGIKNGRIHALDRSLDKGSDRVLDVSGKLVVPGLIDLHTHVYWGGTSISINPETCLARSGVTTWVDAGSAGAGNFTGFKRHVIDTAQVRILAFLNIAFAGIFGYMETEGDDIDAGWVGDLCDIRLANVDAAVGIAAKFPETIVGIKIRAGFGGCDFPGIKPVEIAKRAAETIDKPLMVHIGFPPPSTSKLLSVLKRGDILTHAFREAPNSLLDNDGQLLPELASARKRGVLLDIGHGSGSFSFNAARILLDRDVQPDIISSDLHALSVKGPACDLPTTMSKMLMLGMPLEDVISAVTCGPAAVMGLEKELGTMKLGTTADITVLERETGEFEFQDCFNHRKVAQERLTPKALILGGEVLFAEK
jgi:dihydroorotase